MTNEIIQWHPAFSAALRIELADEMQKLQIESEHLLGKKPMQIDVLVITKEKNEIIHKNIGQIFRKYNIIEYKSPDDYVSINDFYKVYGYACFYQSDTERVGEIDPEELTITFVCSHYPRKMVKTVCRLRGLTEEKLEKGIYYLNGDQFPIQIVVINQLSKEKNYWMQKLRKDVKPGKEMKDLVKRYEQKRNQPLYQAVMDAVIRANRGAVKEEDFMCEALREIFAEEIDAIIKKEVEEKAEVSIRENRKELDKEWKKLDKSREELDKGREELDKGREELDKSREELDKGREELDKGREELDKGREELNIRRMELEKRGVDRMGKLVKFLLKKKQYDILEQISEDEVYREQMFMEYKIS